MLKGSSACATGSLTSCSLPWYRRRALTIGAVYFCGFFFGPIVSRLASLPVAPVFVLLGNLSGPHGHRLYLMLAVVLAFTCWALRAWGGAYLFPAVVWNADALDDRLIVAGPFRFVRNPLYLGNVLLAVATGLYATPLGAAVIVIGNVAAAIALTSVEELLLRQRYGAAFEAYAKNVPALLPRLVPWRGEASAAAMPSIALGFRSEIFSALFVIGTAALAVFFW